MAEPIKPASSPATVSALTDEFKKRVNTNDKNIEKYFSLLFFYILLLFPGVHLKYKIGKADANKKELVVEWYVFSKLVFSILAVCIYNRLPGLFKHIVLWILVAFTVETILNNLLYILSNKLFSVPRSYKRVIILSFANYLEIIFNFSYFYAAGNLIRLDPPANSITELTQVDYLFFSISTGGILGYGDYALYSNEGKILAMLQGLLLLMFFGLFVAYNISLFATK